MAVMVLIGSTISLLVATKKKAEDLGRRGASQGEMPPIAYPASLSSIKTARKFRSRQVPKQECVGNFVFEP